jgi:hypothetical protein
MVSSPVAVMASPSVALSLSDRKGPSPGRPLVCTAANEADDLLACGAVEVPCRLVGEQDMWIVGERAGDRERRLRAR